MKFLAAKRLNWHKF